MVRSISRYRPPIPASSPYITAAGYRARVAELEKLWTRRASVTEALSAAAAEGDRSENAEYIYRKKELAEIDRRIRYLQKRLPDLKIVDRVANKAKIYFGAVVTIEDEHGEEKRYRLVGADETSAPEGWISIDSPLAQGLLGKQIDDEIEVQIKEEPRRYVILEIDYDSQRD